MTPSVDPALIKAWITGWALARGTSPPVVDGEAFRVDVDWPQQRSRYVFPRLGQGVAALAKTITDPWIYLKVCASVEELRPLLPPRWSIMPASYVMISSDAAASPPGGLPDGYRIDIDNTGTMCVSIRAANGDVAASGYVVVAGFFAIYDRIETHIDHQRRGLGRAVMATLAALARERGATCGLLVATAAGRALYETIGWRVYSPYASAVIWAG